MINPGVILLASLNQTEKMKFPYRFEIEDNIGEAIHIHIKDIRLDLTVEEFEALADQMGDFINQMIEVPGFDYRDFAPVLLVGLSGSLPYLKKIEIEQIPLEDIMVDTYDAEGKPIFASIAHSRVFKALCGIMGENDRHTLQLNHRKSGSLDFMSNQERVLYILEQVRTQGYPVGNDYIGVDENYRIWDGQHRAACLYYLYGNIKVPVRRLYYGETAEYVRNEQRKAREEEYHLWQEEVEECQTRGKKKSFPKLRNALKHISWCTWRKSDRDRDDIFQKLGEVSEKLGEVERKIEAKG